MTDARELQTAVVQAIRDELGARVWTRKALADRSGINEQTLGRVMACMRDMNLDQLDRVALALDVSPAYLLTEAQRRSAGTVPRWSR